MTKINNTAKRCFCLSLVWLSFFCAQAVAVESVDPTRPTLPGNLNDEIKTHEGTEASSGNQNMQLNAIIYSHAMDKPIVIINGTILGIRDVINGYKIQAITSQSVTLLSHEGKKLILKFDSLDVKKSHADTTGNNA